MVYSQRFVIGLCRAVSCLDFFLRLDLTETSEISKNELEKHYILHIRQLTNMKMDNFIDEILVSTDKSKLVPSFLDY